VIETAVGETNLTVTIEGGSASRSASATRPSTARAPGARAVLVTAPNGARSAGSSPTSVRSPPGDDLGENGLLVVTVLLNVRGGRRELREGGARMVAERVPLPPGPTSSGAGSTRTRCAPAASADRRPDVLAVIFMLLYVTYGSFLDAPGAARGAVRLAGGIYLQYLLGYNFSVAVWVGFIGCSARPCKPRS